MEGAMKSPSPEPALSEASKEDATASSLEQPFAGNVSQYTPAPPDGQADGGKGILQFDACFEGGVVAMGNHVLAVLILH